MSLKISHDVHHHGGIAVHYKVTVILTPQPEGGYTVTCDELPELVTEGDSVDESLDNVVDAFAATLELYEDLARSLPEGIQIASEKMPAKTKRPSFQTMTPRLKSTSVFDEDVPDLWFQTIVPRLESSPHVP